MPPSGGLVFIYKVQLENPHARKDGQGHYAPAPPGETFDPGPRQILPNDWVCVSTQFLPPVAKALMSSAAPKLGRVGQGLSRPGEGEGCFEIQGDTVAGTS